MSKDNFSYEKEDLENEFEDESDDEFEDEFNDFDLDEDDYGSFSEEEYY